jgi:Raf kinase inhibitor-like YbhB/YbcL family protein
VAVGEAEPDSEAGVDHDKGVREHEGVSHRLRAWWISGVATLLFISCGGPSGSGDAEDLADKPLDAVITVTSPAFTDGAPIPTEFSCDGDDVSPPLAWAGVPDDAVELALVVDDPDARNGPYVHWVLFGLDPSVSGLEQGEVLAGARQAKNSAGDAEYKGPCPPGGDDAHHYRFTVYALGEKITVDDGADTGDALKAVDEAATAKGTLTGTFDR